MILVASIMKLGKWDKDCLRHSELCRDMLLHLSLFVFTFNNQLPFV